MGFSRQEYWSGSFKNKYDLWPQIPLWRIIYWGILSGKNNLNIHQHKKNWKKSAAAAKSHQSCPTLYDPTDGSPPGSPVPGILQARTLEWVAISFSNAWKWKVKWSHVQLFATSWTAACQAPPSMGVSRQEYRSGSPVPSSTAELDHNPFSTQIWVFQSL